MIKQNCAFETFIVFFLLALNAIEAFNLRGLLLGPTDNERPTDSKLDISFGNTFITRDEESGEVQLGEKEVNYYCNSFPEEKSKDGISINLTHSVSYSDYIGSTYFQSSYQIENNSKDKKICGLKIEIPGSEDMDVFISAGVTFNKERKEEDVLKGDLIKDTVYAEPGDTFNIFYTLVESTDKVESTKVPNLCVEDYVECTTEEVEDRTPLDSFTW